jgi:peptidoglycan/LPS O-acetylase OafA/YrhL
MTLTTFAIAAFGAPRLHASFSEWLVNLVIAAPAFGQPYIDSVYWTIVCEIAFYVLVGIAIAVGLFPRRLQALIAAWLVVSALNEAWLGSSLLRHLLVTNYSGFFASGVMLYAIHRGRRNVLAALLLAASVILAAMQADLAVDWMRQNGVALAPGIVVSLSLLAFGLVVVCLFIKRLPVSRETALVIGGLTYPLYLIHQMLGYAVFNRLEGKVPPLPLLAGTIAAMLLLALAIYCLVDRPAQRWLRSLLTKLLGSGPHRDVREDEGARPRRELPALSGN